MKSEYVECECSSSEHTLRFSWFDTDSDYVYVSVFLAQHQGLFRRCWAALKYVFGYTSAYGHFEETLLNEQKAKKIRELLQHVCKKPFISDNTDTTI